MSEVLIGMILIGINELKLILQCIFAPFYRQAVLKFCGRVQQICYSFPLFPGAFFCRVYIFYRETVNYQQHIKDGMPQASQ